MKTEPGEVFARRGEQIRCGVWGCGATPTQAFDVWSWFRPTNEQKAAHYEVCDDHAEVYFGESLDQPRSLRIKRDVLEWHSARHPREPVNSRRPKRPKSALVYGLS